MSETSFKTLAMKRKSWDEFRSSGLAWLINSTLHLFGWAIVFEMEGGAVKDCYPARVNFRGFEPADNDEGYKKVTGYLAENIDDLKKEMEE
jgi:hypothetical protein